MPSPSTVARRAIAASGPLRTAVKSGPAQHAIVTLRAARILTPALAFTARQTARGGGCYTLRGTGEKVHLRHRTRDAAIVVELFGDRPSYDPPEIVSGLTGPVRVLDLGGNIGLFGLFALRRWNVTQLLSFEPDPENYALMSECARSHGQWETVQAAVSNQSGTLRFMTGRFSESRTADPDEPAETVPSVDLFAYGPCDLLKIDIEGGEWPLLADPRLEGFARVVVVEWHSRGCPEADAHATAKRLLAERGYVSQHDLAHETSSSGLVWAWH